MQVSGFPHLVGDAGGEQTRRSQPLQRTICSCSLRSDVTSFTRRGCRSLRLPQRAETTPRCSRRAALPCPSPIVSWFSTLPSARAERETPGSPVARRPRGHDRSADHLALAASEHALPALAHEGDATDGSRVTMASPNWRSGSRGILGCSSSRGEDARSPGRGGMVSKGAQDERHPAR